MKAPPEGRREGPKSSRRLGSRWRPHLLMLPAVVFVALVTFVPLVYSMFVSLWKTNYLDLQRFTGWENYLWIWTDGAAPVRVTLEFVLGSLVLVMPLGILLAVLLNRPLRFKRLFRTILVIPWTVSLVVTALLWTWLLDSHFGPLDYALGKQIDFLGSPNLAIIALIVVNVWQSVPYVMLLVLAGLQTVPQELMDAAKVDGAGPVKRFAYVVLPWIKPSILVAMIMMSIHYVNEITLPLVLTGGGPVSATTTLSMVVYQNAFSFNNYGLAAAVAMYMFIFNGLFSVAYLRLIRQTRG